MNSRNKNLLILAGTALMLLSFTTGLEYLDSFYGLGIFAEEFLDELSLFAVLTAFVLFYSKIKEMK